MDKQISQSTISRRRRATVFAAAGMLAAVCAAAWGINSVVRPSIGADGIVVSEVRRGDIANAISASGVVIPVHEELVSSPIQTRVAKVHARLGQEVAAGDVLLQLDDHTIRLAMDSLAEQVAQQDNRIAALALEMAQKRKQTDSNIELLELDLESARVKRERYRTLRKAGGVSGEDMLAAELNVRRIEIQLRQQRELGDDTRKATQGSIEGARLQKNILHKQLVQQQMLLERARVRAPFAGTLTALAAEEGASVAMGQLVARISEPSNYRVEASVSDFHARALSPGQRVRVEQGRQALAGRVHTILPEIQNGAIRLLVALDQPSHPLLRNKMRVDVSIITDQKSGVLVADNGPAFNGRGRQSLFLVRDGVAHKTVLDIGHGDGKAVEIVSGARPGDQVIVSDLGPLKEHDTIRITR